MRKIFFALLAGCACSCTSPQAGPREIDVCKTGRIDLDGDGIQEQLVITSGGGTGGPVWYLARNRCSRERYLTGRREVPQPHVPPRPATIGTDIFSVQIQQKKRRPN